MTVGPSLVNHCYFVVSWFQQALQDEAIKKKESLGSEIVILRGELQQVREDRDRQLSHVEELNATVAKYKESTGKSVAMLDNLTLKSDALEVSTVRLIYYSCYSCLVCWVLKFQVSLAGKMFFSS